MRILNSAKRAVVAAWLFVSIHPALADEADKPTKDIQTAKLDHITVYATRDPLPAFQVPGSVSVIEREEIDDLNPSSLSDIFERIPGAQFTGGPRRSGETPSLRGLSGPGVLILLDGARQSFVSGHDGRIFVDPEILSAVEVIRGPGSALYGSGALGGVIALRTLEARDLMDEGTQFMAGLKTGFDTVKDERFVSGTAAYSSKTGQSGLVANATYRTSDDIRLGSGAKLAADDTVNSLLLKGHTQINSSLKLTADWIRYRLDTTDPSNPQDGEAASSENPMVDRKISSDTAILRADINPEGNDWIDGYVSLFGAFTEVEKAETESAREVSRDVKSFGVSLVNHSQPYDWLTLTYGFENHRDKQRGTDTETPDGSFGGVPDAKAYFYGGFVQAEIAIDEPGFGSLTFLPGIRVDHFEAEADGSPTTDDTAFSPKLGVRYEPTDWLMIFGNVAKAFRAPSFNEIYADGNHFVVPLPGADVANEFIINPDLQPEKSFSFELGAGVDFKDVVQSRDRLMAKASYWQADVDDLINLFVKFDTFAPNPFDPTYANCFSPVPIPGAPACPSGADAGFYSQYVNTDAKLNGVELELDYDSPTVFAHLTFATINGREKYPNPDDPRSIAHLYPDRVKLDAGFYLVESRAVKFGTRITWADDFTEAATEAENRDGYMTYDIYAVYQPVSGVLEGFRLDAAIENLTDKDYEVVYAGVSEPGRNVKLSVRYSLSF